jgi:hypothetical protein
MQPIGLAPVARDAPAVDPEWGRDAEHVEDRRARSARLTFCATRTPRGMPGPRTSSGTAMTSWYIVRPWSTEPCSMNSSP